MSFLGGIVDLLRDPPPEFTFEIAADGIAMSRTRPPVLVQHIALAPGVVAPSPVKENVLDAAAFAEAVRRLVPAKSGRRGATLILPDNSVRVAVLDFDTLPEKEAELRSLIRFRLRKSVPFDIDEAALSYVRQDGKKIVAAFTPFEIVARYEAPFLAAGLEPGLMTVSSLAMLDLLPAAGSLLIAKRSPGALTVMAIVHGVLTIVRSLELAAETTAPTGTLDPLEEVSSAIYPTMAYIEDQGGIRPDKLVIAGFGRDSDTAATRLSVELEIPAEAIDEPHPGLAGYLASLSLRMASGKPAPKAKTGTAAA